MLKQLEDYAATQGLLGESAEESQTTNEVVAVEIQQGDSTQEAIEGGRVGSVRHGTIAVGVHGSRSEPRKA